MFTYKHFVYIILILLTSNLKSQTKFIDPTGTYVLNNQGNTDSLNIYTRMEIKWISGTRVAIRFHINSKYGMELKPISFIDEDNMIVFRTADAYPGCNTVFYIYSDSLKVLDLKQDAHTPCVRYGGMFSSGRYIKTSKIEPHIGGTMDAR